MTRQLQGSMNTTLVSTTMKRSSEHTHLTHKFHLRLYRLCPARWRQYQEDRKALSQFVSRMRIQFGHMMSSAQQGEYKRIGDSLYLIHKYNLAIQSMCRPDHHEVVYKKVRGVDPMLANRR